MESRPALAVFAALDKNEKCRPSLKQCRLDFCRPRAIWSVTDWRRVIFGDESRFSLSDDHRTRVWRRTGQRSDPAFIVESGIQQFHKVPFINRIMLVHILRDSPQQCLQGYDVLTWPARSPDLSPMGSMSVRVAGRQLQPSRDTEN
ncbi:HTH_Tnp_Tc3_2 domain-containing protein [Trichonephila clavipes]|nr:HTH_Tnp_Tc3_2 domain-containing protein [Trichonephila clavipes]